MSARRSGTDKTLMERLRTDRRGVITIMLALLLPIMVGFIGLGIEVGMWFENKRDIQTAADAAAIAGVYEALEANSTESSIDAAAETDATLNGYDSSNHTIDANNPPNTGSYTSDADAVEVIITSTVNLLFAGVFLDNAVSITARAVATAEAGGDEACVLALDTSASGAVGVSGTAAVEMDGCVVATNSSHSKSIDVNGNASLTVDCVSTVGGIDGTVTLDVCTDANLGVATITDPYESLGMPAEASTCDTESDPDVDGDFTQAQNDTNGDGVVVFCDNISINNSADVTFESDTVYVFNDSTLTINGGADVDGTGVTFIFTGSGANCCGLNITGGGDVTLSAPTSGDYSGILFYQDRTVTANNSNNFSFSGNSDTELTGVIYVPNNDVSFTGGNDLDDNGCLQIVAQTVSFSGNADIENECDGLGMSSIYTSYVAGLVE